MNNVLEEKSSDKQDSFRVDVFDAANAGRLVKDQRDIRISGGLSGEAVYVKGRNNGHITVNAGPSETPKIIVTPGAEANITVADNSKAEIFYKDVAKGNVMLEGASEATINSDSATIGLYVLENAVAKLTATAESKLNVNDLGAGKLEIDMSDTSKVRFSENPDGYSSIKINAKDDTEIVFEGEPKSKFDISKTRDVLLTSIEANNHAALLQDAGMVEVRDAEAAQKALDEGFDIRLMPGFGGGTVRPTGDRFAEVVVATGPSDHPRIVLYDQERVDIKVEQGAAATVTAERSRVNIDAESATLNVVTEYRSEVSVNATAKSDLAVKALGGEQVEINISDETKLKYEGGDETLGKIVARDESEIEISGALGGPVLIDKSDKVTLHTSDNALVMFAPRDEHAAISEKIFDESYGKRLGSSEIVKALFVRELRNEASSQTDMRYKALAEEFRTGDLDKLRERPEFKSAVEALETGVKYIAAVEGSDTPKALTAQGELRNKIAGVIEAGRSIAVKSEAIPKQVPINAEPRPAATETRAVESPKLTA